MRNLSLVKTLTHLKEERNHSEEVTLESAGLSFMRGTVAEFAGGPSTGKTSLVLSLLSKLTRAGEVCAVVDSTNSFDPCSAVTSGVEIENLLWVKCGGDLEKAFISADYLVQAKGFGAVWLNLSGLPKHKLRAVPKTYWYRYRTRIKETPTLILVTAEEPVTGSASQHAFTLSRDSVEWTGSGRYKLLKEFSLNLHSRKEFYGKQMPARIGFDYADAYETQTVARTLSASPPRGRKHKAPRVSVGWNAEDNRAHEMGDRAPAFIPPHQLSPPSGGGERAEEYAALAEHHQKHFQPALAQPSLG